MSIARISPFQPERNPFVSVHVKKEGAIAEPVMVHCTLNIVGQLQQEQINLVSIWQFVIFILAIGIHSKTSFYAQRMNLGQHLRI